ncbi:MAG: ATP-binding protein, partial [Candidatus Poseidoniales archaeon]
MRELAAWAMIGEAVSLLDLPPLRGNPFELRPIESTRAQDLVGRDSLMTRLREHIISESPRMVLLVGERGSGRTSLVNALSSQVNKKFVGQFWPQDEAVSSVMNEIAVHFIGYDVPPSTGQMCERLIDTL